MKKKPYETPLNEALKGVPDAVLEAVSLGNLAGSAMGELTSSLAGDLGGEMAGKADAQSSTEQTSGLYASEDSQPNSASGGDFADNSAGKSDVGATSKQTLGLYSEAAAQATGGLGEAANEALAEEAATVATVAANGRLAKARAMRALLRNNAQSLDDDALDGLGVAPFFGDWRKGAHYRAGEIVAHGGRLYRAILAHNGRDDWSPDAAPTLFHPLRAAKASPDAPDATPDWVKPRGARNGYNTGALVRYEGQIWRSAVNFNTRAPGDMSGQWVNTQPVSH